MISPLSTGQPGEAFHHLAADEARAKQSHIDFKNTGTLTLGAGIFAQIGGTPEIVKIAFGRQLDLRRRKIRHKLGVGAGRAYHLDAALQEGLGKVFDGAGGI